MSRYAEGTSVPMDRSRAEAEKTLIRYGATGFHYAWDRREVVLTLRPQHTSWCPAVSPPPGGRPCTCGHERKAQRDFVIVGFKMPTPGGARRVQLEVPMPHELEVGTKAKADAAARQRWRALCLVLKAKLEAVASGISTLEAEFLANVVLDNGMTIGQALLPRLSEAVSSGRLLSASTEA
jgi:hypothetical protein